jgi:hypothetical protein
MHKSWKKYKASMQIKRKMPMLAFYHVSNAIGTKNMQEKAA